jgi:hypothetical protein
VSGTVDALSLPPERAIAFFRQKVNMPTRAWDDLRHGAHARAWSVAGVQAQDMLTDIRAAMDKAIAQGTTLEEFRRDINPLLGRLGWADRGPGYVAWRTRVVYETNMRTAYAAGRYAEMTDPDVLAARPFWRYRHSGKKDFRQLHKDWDGKVIPASDDFWKTHFPPNGWGCGCYVQSLGPRDLARLGMDGPDQAPSSGGRPWTDPRTNEKHVVPAGIDPGWDYSVGRSWLNGTMPPELAEQLRPATAIAERQVPANLAPLPPVRPADPSLILPDGLPDEDYARAFLEPLGATLDRAAVLRDVQGTRIVVGRDLFTAADGSLKIRKRGRHRFMRLLALALLDPDEIWLDWALIGGEAVLRRRYLRRFALGREGNAMTAFEWTPAGWYGVTSYNTKATSVEAQRTGVLLYRRRDEE